MTKQGGIMYECFETALQEQNKVIVCFRSRIGATSASRGFERHHEITLPMIDIVILME